MIRIVRSTLILATLVLANLAVTGLHAQQSPPAPETPSQAVLENWNDIGKRLLTMADDWPADKYSYKLTPATRSFSQVLLHIAGSNYDLLNRVSGTKMGDGRNDPPDAEYKTKAEVIAFLKKSIDDGAVEIQKEGDAGVLKHLEDWIGYTEHMGEHYGLLVACYRANNVVPPESRPKK
jgi:DinB family protein